ncbi:hypothetical protein K239x_39340 [Planctomycetes bacterium K23_9]|uniref:Alpha/beta hydrolase family protein n=2 Tax=Stieleria marina TaxID=1930275 RepID=A0A517NXT1_9BACT|nr:hypothetical protein K239x_39340 [Planctomycetes bacterium K23_9]
MVYPLQRYLRKRFSSVVCWDYPRVFTDLDRTLDQLALRFDQHTDGSVAVVAHSFGDWVVRSALHRMKSRAVNSLVSVCPVVTSVAAAEILSQVSSDLVPELTVMANVEQSEVPLPNQMNIKRSLVWARGETLVRRPKDLAMYDRERRVFAFHNTILFQFNGWKAIQEELIALAEQR